jgi:hypothetical protein
VSSVAFPGRNSAQHDRSGGIPGAHAPPMRQPANQFRIGFPLPNALQSQLDNGAISLKQRARASIPNLIATARSATT